MTRDNRFKSVFPPGFDASSKSEGDPGPYIHSTEQLFTALVDGYNPMTNAEAIIVKSARYGKQTVSPKHEFILIQVEYMHEEEKEGEVLVNYLVLDRNVLTKHAKSGIPSTHSRTALRGGKPVDMFKVSYDGKLGQLLEDCDLASVRYLEKLEFPPDKPLQLYELVTLAHVVSTQNPRYHATNSNCYMFAGVIWDSLCRLYPTPIHEKPLWEERGKNGWYRYTVTPSKLEDTCQKALAKILQAKKRIGAQQSVSSIRSSETQGEAKLYGVAHKEFDKYVQTQVALKKTSSGDDN